MKCSFTLDHYREMIENCLKSGYTFLGFHQPVPANAHRVIYLRHDLDVCIEEAIDMANCEASLGVRATYFVLVNSPLYNLLAQDTLKLLNYIQSKGHWIGLHIDANALPNDPVKIEIEVTRLFDLYASKIPLVRVVSFHRPRQEVLGYDFNAFISTYSSHFFKKIKYISDSRGIWREGCPCQLLSSGVYQAVQLLVHPIWWKVGEESLQDRLRRLLGNRFEIFRQYLAENISSGIGEILEKANLKMGCE